MTYNAEFRVTKKPRGPEGGAFELVVRDQDTTLQRLELQPDPPLLQDIEDRWGPEMAEKSFDQALESEWFDAEEFEDHHERPYCSPYEPSEEYLLHVLKSYGWKPTGVYSEQTNRYELETPEPGELRKLLELDDPLEWDDEKEEAEEFETLTIKVRRSDRSPVNLATKKDLAARFGVTYPAILGWLTRYDNSPEPVLILNDYTEVFDLRSFDLWVLNKFGGDKYPAALASAFTEPDEER